MKLTTNSILKLYGVIAFAIMACLPVSLFAAPWLKSHQPTPVDSVATVQVMVTQTVVAMTQNAPTPIVIPASATPVPATSMPVPTNTPLPTPTTVSYCDWVSFIKDVSIPDGTRLDAGDAFTKSWRLKNRGTCTWTPEYMLVYTSGDPMGSPNAVRLPGYVAPGQTVDISVTLTAPSKRGHYVSYWMLRNPSGVLFGYGTAANQAFYVDIRVEDLLPHGEVSGSFYYPSEFNPPLTLYFENADTGALIQFSIPQANPTYKVLLPKGRYYAYAWAPGYNLQGAYVNDSLTMKSFVVKGGQTITGINLTDWSLYPHSRGG